jgi:glycosyltransferase involved in cell wall biosynthesis
LSVIEKEGILHPINIDFYGPIDDSYKAKFFSNLIRFENCNYRGYLDLLNEPEENYSILSNYYAMLFPTIYVGEGFPGVIIDAYISGLPVIASNWHLNSEIILDGVNGLLFPPNDSIALANAMKWMLDNRAEVSSMRKVSNSMASSYDVNKILDTHLLPMLKLI